MILEKKPAIGVENYKRMVEKSYYYVDKTLLIRELLDTGAMVNLFTRPRRFGKTLALSMLKTFFEAEISRDGEMTDNRPYFEGMKIMEAGERYTRHLGRYPVIALSLKAARQPNFEMALDCLIMEISKEFERHDYVLQGDCLREYDKTLFYDIMSRQAELSSYATSLRFLSECLKKYHGFNAVILLDEYDVPLETAWFRGFYDRMLDFIRSLFESSLKTNDSLELAVITGCLRISKESIFTGLNNLNVVSVLNDSFSECFGFTGEEVQQMLDFYGIDKKLDEVKTWYDGYLFGNTEVYNPWSLLHYVRDALTQSRFFPKPYWSKTSSNNIIRELVDYADTGVKKEIEALIAGGTIEKPIHEDITYEDIRKSQDNLWNFLFFTGYLKTTGQRLKGNEIYLTLQIPNEEIRYIYQNAIREWFEEKMKRTDFTEFYQALMKGEADKIEDFISRQLGGSISYYDSAETFYLGYLLGILSGLEGYELSSNKEQGDGRPDIVLSPFQPKKPAVILEIKRVNKFSQMETGCDQALSQIEEKHYDTELLNMGYRVILKYGICFCRKTCRVKRKD